jgi:hypothetical protein
VKSSAGIVRAKRVLRELESFRQLIGTTMVFRNVVLPELPIEVLLIGDQAQYSELSPAFNGKKVKVAGYYERGQDRDFIVLQSNAPGNLTHVVYHELTHSFVSRSLDIREAWLSEGLAEYFSTAEVHDDVIYLGGLSLERLEVLKNAKLLPLADLMTVDDRSPYYNENDKANLFYSESWAFVHFLMHGPHSSEFRAYLEALTRGKAEFDSYVTTNLDTLGIEFQRYLKSGIHMSGHDKVKPHPEKWRMTTDSITAADVELSITEIFLSGGRLDDARRHLESVAGLDDHYARASYYRGILARISKEEDPREFFIDALMDPTFGPRAAINLVQLHELSIPGARRALEQAAAAGTHIGDVYWAISEIYLDEAHRAWDLLQIAKTTPSAKSAISPPLEGGVPRSGGLVEPDELAELVLKPYSHGDGDHFRYELQSTTGEGPIVRTLVVPNFPDELVSQRVGGQVVIDLQVTDKGEVAGMWLVSSLPEIFTDLATTAVHDWKFNSGPQKIRAVVQFIP